MSTYDPNYSEKPRKVAIGTGAAATLLIPINFFVFTGSFDEDGLIPVFLVLCVLQLLLGVIAAVAAGMHAHRADPNFTSKGVWITGAVLAGLVGLGGPVGLVLGVFAHALTGIGGAWGRPLRVKGRVVHPELRGGADWTRGARPRVDDLDRPTRRALEALWLHDAQKEHASVPAFARISWLLAAVGAPAELMEEAHRAGMQEIDHARRCFALAAGYGGRSHSVEAMPDLLLGGLDLDGDPHVHLAVESLEDGCLLEDFNADVAAVCARECEDPATRDVLDRITTEEREHAEFSWALLTWLLEDRPAKVRPAIERALGRLERVRRPTAVSGQKCALVEAADSGALRRHGRIDDTEWAAIWTERLAATRARATELLEGRARAA